MIDMLSNVDYVFGVLLLGTLSAIGLYLTRED